MYKRIIVLVIFVLAIVIGSISISYSSLNECEYINVEVKGEVKYEKNYTLPLGSTINDLIDNLELKENSDISSLSRTQILYNNQIVIIPSKSSYDLISINSASIDSLSSLPGIGKSIALKICEYRENNGSFNTLDELKNVSGIGEKKFEKIKKYITL